MLDPVNLTIDAIQNGKKQFIEKYIKNTNLKNSWTKYVDTQSAFLHSAMETNLEMSSELTKTFMDTKLEKLYNPFAIDWFQAGWDAYQQNNRK
jgi:hypothetical protein